MINNIVLVIIVVVPIIFGFMYFRMSKRYNEMLIEIEFLNILMDQMDIVIKKEKERRLKAEGKLKEKTLPKMEEK